LVYRHSLVFRAANEVYQQQKLWLPCFKLRAVG
jgi:hypothetical protein